MLLGGNQRNAEEICLIRNRIGLWLLLHLCASVFIIISSEMEKKKKRWHRCFWRIQNLHEGMKEGMDLGRGGEAEA